MLERDAAPGIHRVEDANVNWYIVEGDGGLTLVDAGVPRSWSSLHKALAALGRPPSAIRALVLTHAHFDHIGFAERARSELGIPVWVHEDDVPLTRKPLQYSHERARSRYLLTHPRALPIVAGLTMARAFWPRPIGEVRRFSDSAPAVPGSPRVVPTPGHTIGHCALHFPDRDAVLAGDAVVTLDPYTGKKGPRLVARAAQADSERAFDSLAALSETEAGIVLTGHGEVWRGGVEEATSQARAVGLS